MLTSVPSQYRARTNLGRSAFSLVEMIVVVAVILLLVGLVAPAASALWAQRKVADSENLLTGVLITARARAIQSGGGQTGLLFWVDDRGAQHVSPLEQASTSDILYENVFRFADQPDVVMPIPMRAVPRYCVEPGDNDNPFRYEDAELANNDYFNPVSPNVAQRHRNFFSMIFSARGEPMLWRDVLIQDDDKDLNGRGDRTGFRVGRGQPSPVDPDVKQYFVQTGDTGVVDIDPRNNPQPVPNLITNADTSQPIAVNLPSMDGVLVYDDSLLNRLRVDPGTDGRHMREFLKDTAQPFYVSRLTGALVRGALPEITTP